MVPFGLRCRKINGRVLFPVITILLTFLILIPIWCRRYPRWCNHAIYDICNVRIPSQEELDDESIRQTEIAKRSLENYRLNFTQSLEDYRSSFMRSFEDYRLMTRSMNSTAKLSMVIIAKRRPYPVINGKSPRYLTQVVWKLRQSINDTHLQSIVSPDIVICNVDDEPNEFIEAVELAQHPYIRVINEDRIPIGSSISEADRIFEMEKASYLFCLRQASDRMRNEDMVIVFEDDALPVDEFGPMIRSVVDQITARALRHRSVPIFVKLYHPERYRKLPWLLFVVSYSFAVTFTSELIIHLAKSRRSNGRCSLIRMTWIFSYCAILLWCLGHQSVAYVRSVLTGGSIYLVVHESCCTPAILYTRSGAITLIDYLNVRVARDGYAIDHMLDEAPGLFGLMTDTNLIRHIGRYSTLRAAPVKADPW